MSPLHYRDMIIRASKAGDMRRIDQLAAQLAQAEEARDPLPSVRCPRHRAPSVISPAVQQHLNLKE